MDEISFLLKEYTLYVAVLCQSNKRPRVADPFLGFQLPRSKIPKWMHSARISKLACPFFSTHEGTLRRKAEVVGMHKTHPFPTEELLERIPPAVSVISGLRHYVLII